MPITVDLITSFPIPGANDIAYPGSGTLIYVAQSGSGSRLSSIDWSTSTTTPSADTNSAKHIIWDGVHLWLDEDANSSDSHVYFFDRSTLLEAGSVDTTQLSPSYLSGDGAFIYAANPNNNSVNKMTAAGLTANLPSFGALPVQTSSPIVNALGTQWFINSNNPSGSFQFANLAGVIVALPTLFDAVNGMIFDGTNFWYTDATNQTLVQISPAGATLNTVALGAIPIGLGFDGTYLWCGTIAAQTLKVFDLTGTLQADIDLTLVSPNGTPIYVTSGIPGYTFVSVLANVIANSVVLQFQIAAPPATGGRIFGHPVAVVEAGQISG
jgi:hypothetical protein